MQRYIQDPLLINAHKSDMRVYVAVTSVQPLRVYVYEDGLVRFATSPYSTSKASLKNRGVHLTNYSVNKSKQGFVRGEDGAGSKWSLKAFFRHLDEGSAPGGSARVWEQICNIVARTLSAVEPKITSLVRVRAGQWS